MTSPFSSRICDVQHGFPILNRYWSDRDYQVQCRIEADHQNALNNSAMDRRMIATGNRFPCDWTAQEKHDAIERMMK